MSMQKSEQFKAVKHQEQKDLGQIALLRKMHVFLTSMDESLPLSELEQVGGICNALVFAVMRADSINQKDKFFERLNKIAEKNEE